MAYSKQQQDGGFESAKSKFIGLDGGLQLKSDPFLTQPPSVTTAKNVWNITPGQVRSLPPIQQGNYASASTYPIYGLYVHEPTDPYTTGDVLVHTETTDANSLMSPSLVSGIGFPSPATTNAVTFPGTIKTRPIGPSTPLYSSNGTRYDNGTSAPFHIVASATLPLAFVVVPGAVNQVPTTGQFLDIKSNTLSSPISLSGVTHASDVMENPASPGQFIVWTISAGQLSPTIYGLVNGVPSIITNSLNGTSLTTSTGASYCTVNFNGAGYIVQQSKSINIQDGNIYAFNTVTGVYTTLATGVDALGVGAWVAGSTLFVAYGTGGTSVVVAAFNTSLVGGTVATFSQSRTSFGLTGYAAGGVGVVWVQDVVSSSTNAAAYVSACTFTYSGTNVTAGTVTQICNPAGVCISSRGLAWGKNTGTVLVRTGSRDLFAPTNSSASPTYFLIDPQCRVVGRCFDGTAPADYSLVSNTSTTLTLDASNWCLPRPSLSPTPDSACTVQAVFPAWRTIVEGFNQGPYTVGQLNSASSLQLGNLGPPNAVAYSGAILILTIPEGMAAPSTVIAGRSIMISGTAVTTLYDGSMPVEAGFHEQPHWPSAGAVVTNTSGNPTGTYLYRYIYRWVDANGQVHRSSPSPALSVTQSSIWTSQNISVPYIMYTQRSISSMNIELYRTDPAGTLFYLVSSTTVPSLFNISSAITNGFVTISDGSPTTASASFGVAYPGYWQSSYESSPPPSFIWQVTAQGRVFGLAQVDGGYRVYYSNVWTPGVTVEFNVQGYLTCPPELGDCRSLDVLDDKVMIFGTVGVGFFNGAGPGVTPGTNGIDLDINNPAFSPITPIPNAAGIVGTGCPVEIPSGVLYQSYEGILEIDRSLKSTPVGAAVDNITGTYGQAQVVYGQGILLSKLQAVLFTNPSGDSLLFDYNQRKWTTWTNAAVGPISGAVQRRDGTIYIAQQPVVGGTLPATFTANGATVNSGVSVLYSPTNPANVLASVTGITPPQYQVETPWLWSGDIPGGEGDVWEAGILGTYYNPHILKVEVATNYQAYGIIAGDTQSFPVNAAPYPSYQFRVHPPVTSRIWAVRFRITVLPPATGTITTFDLARITGIMLFSGSMQGNTRIGAGVSR